MEDVRTHGNHKPDPTYRLPSTGPLIAIRKVICLRFLYLAEPKRTQQSGRARLGRMLNISSFLLLLLCLVRCPVWYLFVLQKKKKSFKDFALSLSASFSLHLSRSSARHRSKHLPAYLVHPLVSHAHFVCVCLLFVGYFLMVFKSILGLVIRLFLLLAFVQSLTLERQKCFPTVQSSAKR